jgi:TetR/AcrR family tetracycline transcriptional repressor
VAVAERTPESLKRRARGKHAGLDLARIVEAARSLDPDTLTMKAVADQLGVDRKAIHHYVNDREALLGLLAVDTFSARFSAVQISAHSQWQEACRSYALGVTDSAIAVGVLTEHLLLDKLLATRFLDTTEAVLKKLIEAGFDDEAAVRSLAMLTNICVGYARDAGLAARNVERPRRSLLREALNERSPQVFENLARIAVSPVDTYDRRQLELSIEVFLRGAAALPRAQSTPAT